jgi:threonyl-tRNA synthetase
LDGLLSIRKNPDSSSYGNGGPKFLLSISGRDYVGNLPLPFAPEQVRIPPIGAEPASLDYAHSTQTELRRHQVRCELDASTDHIKAKIANAEQMKVHTMLVIGKRDLEANAVSVRVHGQGNLGAKPRDEIIADLLSAIKERRA